MTSQENDSKTSIRNTAFKLLMECGVERTSFTLIADESGFGRSLVHYYYPKKDDLIFEFLERLFSAITVVAKRIPQFDEPQYNLVRNGQVYFAFLLKDAGMRRFFLDLLSNRAVTNRIIQMNGDWSLPQLGLPTEGDLFCLRAHIMANGGLFEFVYEQLSAGADALDPGKLSALSLGTFLALHENSAWHETVSDLEGHLLPQNETAPLVEAVSSMMVD